MADHGADNKIDGRRGGWCGKGLFLTAGDACKVFPVAVRAPPVPGKVIFSVQFQSDQFKSGDRESLMNLEPRTMQPSCGNDDLSTVFIPKGVCSKMIRFHVEDGALHDVVFTGGCPGNLEAIGRLVEGMAVSDVIDKLGGICCGSKSTSCADQLVKAVVPYLPE